MDNPEVKALLKSAKDAIKTKDFKEALKICKVNKITINTKLNRFKNKIFYFYSLCTISKSVIERDKENYLGWVMTGAAAFESGIQAQALAAYNRAIQISPTQTPAWQVICFLLLIIFLFLKLQMFIKCFLIGSCSIARKDEQLFRSRYGL